MIRSVIAAIKNSYKRVREINVSRARDPVHAGDKALTQETPVKRGRVNRYAIVGKLCFFNLLYYHEVRYPIYNKGNPS
jgi:hypothetical protein